MQSVIKPLISIITPCYNEEAILNDNINVILQYLSNKKDKYQWEILIINDGSRDKTGAIADEIEKSNKIVRVIHHPVNLNLGNALKTGFRHAKGEVIVVMDIDLSYSVEYIEILVDKLLKFEGQKYVLIFFRNTYFKVQTLLYLWVKELGF